MVSLNVLADTANQPLQNLPFPNRTCRYVGYSFSHTFGQRLKIHAGSGHEGSNAGARTSMVASSRLTEEQMTKIIAGLSGCNSEKQQTMIQNGR